MTRILLFVHPFSSNYRQSQHSVADRMIAPQLLDAHGHSLFDILRLERAGFSEQTS